MIVIKNLSKQFGEKIAIHIEHFSIPQGEMLGLVGNNGAGKTTLFRLMLDLLKADSGHITLRNLPVDRTEEWKSFTGAYIDDSFLIDYLTPEEYFAFIGRLHGLSPSEVDSRLSAFSRFMNGEIRGQKKLIRNFSAGNKQKIGILSALLPHPQIVILDEPFNFLDPTSQSELKQLLLDYNQTHQATLLLSSHNLTHTIDLCPRIALLERGEIIKDLANRNHSAETELEQYFQPPR